MQLGISLDSSGASNFTTSGGDLTLTADANNAKVVIKGDHESDVAIPWDGNADAASIWWMPVYLTMIQVVLLI